MHCNNEDKQPFYHKYNLCLTLNIGSKYLPWFCFVVCKVYNYLKFMVHIHVVLSCIFLPCVCINALHYIVLWYLVLSSREHIIIALLNQFWSHAEFEINFQQTNVTWNMGYATDIFKDKEKQHKLHTLCGNGYKYIYCKIINFVGVY